MAPRRIVLELTDLRSNRVHVAVQVEQMMGEVRNSVNLKLGLGYYVGEHGIVPSPWSHYIVDDPELFGQGPGDEWRVVDVFYEALTRAENSVLLLKATSVAPLGDEHSIGIVFPDLRKVPRQNGRLAAMARRILGHQELSKRVEALVASLESIETAVRSGELRLDRVRAVAGFGFDGEVAALIFAGSLTLEDGLRALEATQCDQDRGIKAWSAVGIDETMLPNDAIVTHYVFDRAFVVLSDRELEPPFKPLEHDLLKTVAAHSPLCPLELADSDYDISEPQIPFYSRGQRQHLPSLGDTMKQPVHFSTTVRTMLEEHNLTRIVEAGASTKLCDILRFVLDPPLSETLGSLPVC